ncbi:MAG: isoprenoid biosynthesis glyoxalase ElbB [Bacillota bacterium]
MAQVGVLLSGCGVSDGSEIHESVLTMLHLARRDQEIVAVAPDILQSEVIDHLTGEEIKRENRDVLVEAARIARGDIKSIAEIDSDQLDALIIPGGAGAIKNLTNYALTSGDCKINLQTKDLILQMIEENKPVGAICIAPLVVAKALATTKYRPQLTVGYECPQSKYIEEELGALHLERAVDEIVVDKELKLVTTPAYMLGESIAEVDAGIAALVDKVVELS